MDELESRIVTLELKVKRLERACVHQLESRDLLDRVGQRTGVPVTTTSEHWHDDEGGDWGGA